MEPVTITPPLDTNGRTDWWNSGVDQSSVNDAIYQKSLFETPVHKVRQFFSNDADTKTRDQLQADFILGRATSDQKQAVLPVFQAYLSDPLILLVIASVGYFFWINRKHQKS